MHKNFKILLLFGFLFSTCFQCLAMDSVIQNEKELLNYKLKEGQPEEKWRWRKSFVISVENSIPHGIPMNFSEFHNTLARTECALSDAEAMKGQDTNILVPGITVIYRRENGDLAQSTGHIYNYQPNYKQTFATFISGAARVNQGFSEVQNISDNNFALLSAFYLKLDPQEYFNSLPEFYKQPIENKDHPLCAFCKFTSGLTDNKSKCENKGTYFSHAEHWLIYYLSKQNRGSLPYDNLCKAIASAVRNEKNITITNVILHIHSTLDICDVCAPSLSVFLENLQSSKKDIMTALQQPKGAFEYNKVVAAIDESLTFSIIASSRLSKLGQAQYRDHYYYKGEKKIHGERRVNFGIDALSHSGETVTKFGAKGLPYSYIQVPIKEIRIEVGDKIPF